jgi:glucose/mannose transport system permease protein
VLAPSFAVILLFVYGFILFTVVLSFTGSKMLPEVLDLGRLRELCASCLQSAGLDHRAEVNMAIFATLYIVICTASG